MGRHIGSHADRNTGGSVDKEVRDSGREYGWFGKGIVEVRDKIDGILVEILKHLLTHSGKLHLRVTHRSRGVAIN